MRPSPEPEVGIIVVAAGSGSRLGHPHPKAFVPVSGRPILVHALEGVFGSGESAQVVVVAPADWIDEARALAAEVAGTAHESVTVVTGSDSRQGSVAAGLAALAPGIRIVLVHDAARAFTPPAQFDAVVAAVRQTGSGVIPGLAVADTIKRVEGGLAVATVDRSELVAVQTPQGFPRQQLAAAYADSSADHTDDAALFAASGHPVVVIDGDALAFKITTPWDLRRAETLLSPVAPAETRTGIGIDVHAFDESSPLWLGGVFWPGEVGLAGHSDGDAISHAICDALLSASGLGDLGSNFGTSDPRFTDAHGEVFLAATVDLVAAAGFVIGNVSVQVVANHPKIGTRRAEIETTLSSLVGAPVSVAATTSDGLGFTGRGDGISVIATCLLQRIGSGSTR
ncbi:2-C-methyl-D-erythritol 2,4-cyclodiphosphate synthase [Glaciihabitans sp. INWT7]|uniref:2-C-methyl-D-erythritol 4-phosphate cytidylyltransferase n=1 Tax=Glaciihabitans sp. INWT7 TaxID=2596912 RepID=UPI001860BB78|nr:2-C-methyl-D-erythritol 4-phosphate cytidylyltransferase [Glaciihabitans sp. INWT7]QNE47814.1 2-C-methyl-D-erythritol 2,4-cyclodiphosphate synthase [Glaciihabitans sp. INWT7]